MLLRLVAGGAPLLSTNQAAAGLASSSGWRAVRHDATQNPPMVSATQDGWVRVPIEIVELSVPGTSANVSPSPSGNASVGQALPAGGLFEPTIQAYKVASAGGPRYFQIDGMRPVSTLYAKEVRSVGNVYSLVLFDDKGGMHGVDPGKSIGFGGLQGLHCSSWRSTRPRPASSPAAGFENPGGTSSAH